jgi:plastocyanin
MSSHSTPIVGVVVSVLIIASLASIGYYQFEVAPHQTTTTTTVSSASCTPASCVNVTIPVGASTTRPGFSPDVVTLVLNVNNTVVWTNADSVQHTVTANDSSWGSGILATGDTFTHTFNSTGTFGYFCSLHPSVMVGEVRVKS